MSKQSRKLSDIIQQQRILINNSLSDPIISERMAEYGYTQEIIQQGKAILDEVEQLYQKQKKNTANIMKLKVIFLLLMIAFITFIFVI